MSLAIARGRGWPCLSRLESIQSLLRRRNGKAFASGWESCGVEEVPPSTCGTPKRASPSTYTARKRFFSTPIAPTNGPPTDVSSSSSHPLLTLSFFRVWSLPWPSFGPWPSCPWTHPPSKEAPAKPYSSLRSGSRGTVPAGPKHDQFGT